MGINCKGNQGQTERAVALEEEEEKEEEKKLITNLNVILYLATCHTVYISALIIFMIMP